MAQKRMLSRRIAASKSIHALKHNDRARFIYALLLPYADRDGRINVNPAGLKGTMLEPFEYTVDEIRESLIDLASVGLITLYSTGEHKLLAEYARFRDFNTPHPKEPDSDFPGPDDEGSEIVDAGGGSEGRGSLPGKDGAASSLNTPTHTPTKTQSLKPEKVSRDSTFDSSEARFARRMETGKHEPYEENRVRATLRRIAGEDFVRDNEGNLASWAHWTDDDLKRLWDASDMRNWPKERAANKWREWIFKDLLREKRHLESDRTYDEPVTAADLMNVGTLEGRWN